VSNLIERVMLQSDVLISLAREAGQVIMEVYNDPGFQVDEKADGSPVTEADRRADAIITKTLVNILPEVPIVSEENAASHVKINGNTFWLVDPLDGTKEFQKRDGKGSFTVNIGLIENGEPVFGLVYAPALNRLFIGAKAKGARELSADNDLSISTLAAPSGEKIAVASSSHRDANTDKWLKENNITKTVSIGSSLKLCLVATGEAHVYPRFGPTMEWDTAAGDAVLRAAGGRLTNPDDTQFIYGKADYKNGAFIAWGS